MATPTPSEPILEKAWDRVLEDDLYSPDAEALAFYKKETRLEDEAELKQHILTVQREAFAVRIAANLRE